MMQWWPQSVGCRTLDCVGMVHWIFFLFSCWKFFLSDTSRISSVQGSVCFCVFDISWMKHAMVGRHRLQATGRPQTSELVCAAVASDSPLDELSEQLVIGCYLFAGCMKAPEYGRAPWKRVAKAGSSSIY